MYAGNLPLMITKDYNEALDKYEDAKLKYSGCYINLNKETRENIKSEFIEVQ